MGGLSDYGEGKVLDHVFGLSSYTAPTNLYVALYTAAPDDTGGGTEVSGNAYARVQVTNSSSSWSRSSNVVSNVGAITFPTPTPSAWGTITHVGLFDASSAGNLIVWDALTTPLVTASGTAPNFPIGDLTISVD